ncbi:uncharacterized protein LOC143284152 [Babylonia areolata]|uniref:uncharacterized protein LOC143284152 n=1 Tax=Babylonia areolata TaxID=304850 RepID=UPI003FD6AE6A
MEMEGAKDSEQPPIFTVGPDTPRWVRFCVEVMMPLELSVMNGIEQHRVELDNASGDQPIQTWHFAFTQDSRNFVVYFMMDMIFGFARHGEGVKKVMDDSRFVELLKFVMSEEHECFIKGRDKVDYFSSLANRVLRLSPLIDYQPEDKEAAIPDDVIPGDPVDVLFQFYGGDEQTAPKQPSMDDTLKALLERKARAEKDNASTAKPGLSAMAVYKECHESLRKLEKRMEKVSLAVKAITQQMLQGPEEGECQVVTLFGRHLFFVAPSGTSGTVGDFLKLQKDLAKGHSQDRADAEACFKVNDFVPLIKDATCMPDSLLSHIDDSCKRHGGQADVAEDGAKPGKKADEKPAESTGGDDSDKENTGDIEKGKPSGESVKTSEIVLKPVDPQNVSPRKVKGEAEDNAKQNTDKKEPESDHIIKPGESESGTRPPIPTETDEPSEPKKTDEKKSPEKKTGEKKSPEKTSEKKSPEKMDEKKSPEKTDESKSPEKKTDETGQSETSQSPEIKPDETTTSTSTSSTTTSTTTTNTTTEAAGAAGEKSAAEGGKKAGSGAVTEAAKRVPASEAEVKSTNKYFENVKILEKAFAHGSGRCIFSVQQGGSDSVDYFSPVMGYLPLMPLIRQLNTRPECDDQIV